MGSQNLQNDPQVGSPEPPPPPTRGPSPFIKKILRGGGAGGNCQAAGLPADVDAFVAGVQRYPELQDINPGVSSFLPSL